MGAFSKIEWTDHSWNPWIGCCHVSPGCQYCYAERDFTRKPRWANTWGPPQTSQRIKTSQANWRKPLTWNEWASAAGRRDKVFCASLCDVFEDNPQVEEWRFELWRLIEQTPSLDWLILTKRPENIEKMVLDEWCLWNWPNSRRFPTNIWLGVSAENQDEFVWRWDVLESVAHHFYPSILFLSLEPLLGPIDLEICLTEMNLGDEEHDHWTRAVDWVIVGGESGPLARPMNPEWVRSIRDQCVEAEVPFHFKHWGDWWLPMSEARRSGDGKQKMACVVERLDLLDGREWNQMPIDPLTLEEVNR